MSASLALASPAVADKIQVGYVGSPYGLHQTGQGGEFTLNDVSPDGWLDLSGYVAGKTSNFGTISSFQTFCLEKDEFIYRFEAIYDVVLSGAAVHGGLGGPDPDPISRGTALLYSQFARGVLAGYDYFGGGRSGSATSSAAKLQEAIWWLEEEINLDAAALGLNPFIGLVVTQFGSAPNGRADAAYGEAGVYVLNMTGADGAGGAPDGVPGQSQLYYVPDGGTTLALLGMALLGVAIVARRFRSA